MSESLNKYMRNIISEMERARVKPQVNIRTDRCLIACTLVRFLVRFLSRM